jgi:hypothetical protein
VLEESKQAQIALMLLFHQVNCIIDIVIMLGDAKKSLTSALPVNR